MLRQIDESPRRLRSWSAGDVRTALLVAALLLIALGLRFYRLDFYDYWDDEVISTLAARPPLTTILSSVGDYSVHPPLYYMLLHLWMGWFGEGLATIRTLSALISAACVPLVYLLGRRLASTPAGLIAAGLMCLAPFQIYHGQQARMYPLLTLIVLLTTLAFLAAWKRGRAWRWGLFGLCVATGLYTHVYFPLSLLALNLWALLETWRERRVDKRRWAGLILAQAAGGLAFLPFTPQLLSTVGGVVQWYWISTISPFDVISLPVVISNGVSVVMFQPQTPTWFLLAALIPAVGAMLGANYYAARAVRQPVPSGPAWTLLLLLLWTPPAVATLVSLTIKPILIDRSLIAITAPAYLLMGWCLAEAWRLPLARVAAAAFVLSMGLVLTMVYAPAPRPNDLRELGDTLAARYEPGDAIAFADWQTFDTVLLTEPDLPGVHVLPAEAQSRVQFTGATEWERRLRYIGWPHLDRIKPVAEFAPEHKRVWLVLSTYNPGLPYQLKTNKAWLDANARLVETIEDWRVVTWLYEIP